MERTPVSRSHDEVFAVGDRVSLQRTMAVYVPAATDPVTLPAGSQGTVVGYDPDAPAGYRWTVAMHPARGQRVVVNARTKDLWGPLL